MSWEDPALYSYAEGSQEIQKPLEAPPPPKGFTDPEPLSYGPSKGEMGFIDTIGDMFTGKSKTQYPELGNFDLPFEFKSRQAKTALGTMMTFDSARQVGILKQNYPELKFSADKFGNVIVDGTPYGGSTGYLNAPGLDARDLIQAGFQISAFTPAGRLGSTMAKAGVSLPSRAAAVGSGSMATQGVLDIESQQMGGEKEPGFGKVDIGDMAVAGVGGTVGEVISPALAAAWKPLKRVFQRAWANGRVITDQAREVFREAAREAGEPVEIVTDDLIMDFMQAADDAVDPRYTAGVQATREFDIPYLRGQAMEEGPGKVEQLAREDTIRNTTGNSMATSRIRDFDQFQQGKMQEASRRIQGGLGREGRVMDRTNQASEIVSEGVSNAENRAWQGVQDAYGEVGEGEMLPEGMINITRGIRRFASRERFILNSETPATTEILKKGGQLNRILNNMKESIKPFHVRQIEAKRREILAIEGTAKNPTDRRQAKMLRDEFDRLYDEAADLGLMSGDENVIEAMKAARYQRARYANLFQEQKPRTRSGREIPDPAGRMIEEIVTGARTPEQVGNMLFGVSKLGGNNASYAFAKRLQDIFEPGSPEWDAVRQGAWLHLTKLNNKGNLSARDFRSRLREATEGKGESYMKLLFSPQEIAMFRRFASALMRGSPDIENPSRTAYKSASMAMDLYKRIMTSIGMAQGGAAGAVAGRAGAEVVDRMGSLRSLIQANRAIRWPMTRDQLRETTVAPAMAPAAVSYGEDPRKRIEGVP